MARFLKKFDKKSGMPPGSLIFIGRQKTETPRLRIIDYDIEMMRDEFIQTIDDAVWAKETETTSWINIDGLHEPELIKTVGDKFNLPPMMLEDILNTGQRPKIEEHPDHIFISIKMLFLDDDQGQVKAEQLSAVLAKNYLITFQEQPGDVFEPVRERIKRQNGRLRKLGPDYLLYTLIDCVLDNYLKVIEKMGERIEEMEDEVLGNPVSELLEEINLYRREIAYIRKSVRPAREIISRINKLESDIISADILPYLRDLSDIAELSVDSAEIYKEMLASHITTYNMAMGNRLNEIMQFLTIFATIFIPLTFLAGIYGMNFDVIPELHYKYGYFVLLSIMVAVTITMLLYFKKRRWI
ncbi:MAG: magnesium/cobalt transporter CorA [Pseudodesulfovibrio sp.]|nr:magnesium/cobalt transporter CorA [Pseudodesulfovibrio sp.]